MGKTVESRHVAFGGCIVQLDSCHSEVSQLLVFLFGDMLVSQAAGNESVAHYRIAMRDDHWHVHYNNVCIGAFNDTAALAEFLSGDVLFRLIEHNQTHLAIHAALVSKPAGSILLPAESGSGKTSVTAWLLTRGWQYHSDELVLINPDGRVTAAFSRPLNIKPGSLNAIAELIGFDGTFDNNDNVRQSTDMTMIRPCLFSHVADGGISQEQSPSLQPIRTILFPNYCTDEPASLQKLTAAAAALELMRSNVIARNLSGHGFTEIVDIAKRAPSFRIAYRHFDDLQPLINELTDSW